MARKLCEMGATNVELAYFFDVAVCTILDWQRTFSSFSDACRIGMDRANARVERSLYERAVGTVRVVEKVGRYKNSSFVMRYHVHVLPDTKACIFWLLNRCPKKWSLNPVAKVSEADPFLTFPKSINGKVVRPVETPSEGKPDLGSVSQDKKIPTGDVEGAQQTVSDGE